MTFQFTPNEVINKTNEEMVLLIFQHLILSSFNEFSQENYNNHLLLMMRNIRFNHVYESESGHLVEIDDTPSKKDCIGIIVQEHLLNFIQKGCV